MFKPTFMLDAFRFWRQTPGRGLLLALIGAASWAIFLANLTMLLPDTWLRPAGVATSLNFATLGASDRDGFFQGVSQKELELLNRLGFRDRYFIFREVNEDIRFNGSHFPKVPIALISNGAVELLGLNISNAITPQGAWLSEEFSSALDSANIVGKTIRVGDTVARIVGILPATFKGLRKPAAKVWLSAQVYESQERIALPLPPELLDSIRVPLIRNVTPYFGIVALENRNDIEVLKLNWQVRTSKSIKFSAFVNGKEEESEFGFNRSGWQPKVFEGVVLNPRDNAALKAKLSVLMLISSFLITLTMVGCATFFITRSMNRGAELQLKSALGAQHWQLLTLFFFEFAPFAILLSLLTYFFLEGANAEILASKLFPAVVQLKISTANLVAAISMFLLLMCASLLPPLSAVKSLRDRSQDRVIAHSGAFVWLELVGIFAQVVFFSIVLYVSLESAGRLQKLASAQYGGSLNSVFIEDFPMAHLPVILEKLPIAQRQLGIMAVAPLHKIALNAEFAVRVDGPVSSMLMNQANASAFLALKVKAIFGESPEKLMRDEVLLSLAAAKALSENPQKLVGSHIFKVQPGLAPRALRIRGIIPDLRYNSYSGKHDLVVYTGLGSFLPTASIIGDQRARANLSEILSEIAQVGQKNTISADAVQSFDEQLTSLSALDRFSAMLAFSYSIFTCIILIFTFSSETRRLFGNRRRKLALINILGATQSQSVGYVFGTIFRIALAGVASGLIMNLILFWYALSWFSVVGSCLVLSCFLISSYFWILGVVSSDSLASAVRLDLS